MSSLTSCWTSEKCRPSCPCSCSWPSTCSSSWSRPTRSSQDQQHCQGNEITCDVLEIVEETMANEFDVITSKGYGKPSIWKCKQCYVEIKSVSKPRDHICGDQQVTEDVISINSRNNEQSRNPSSPNTPTTTPNPSPFLQRNQLPFTNFSTPNHSMFQQPMNQLPSPFLQQMMNPPSGYPPATSYTPSFALPTFPG